MASAIEERGTLLYSAYSLNYEKLESNIQPFDLS